MNIFTANQPRASSSQGGKPANPFQRAFQKWSDRPARIKPLKDRLRLVLDPGIRKQRREVRKWRRWHEAFCALNEIERRLSEVLSLLMQAAASMRCFGESYSGSLCDGSGVAAFLRDAGLYFRSEAEVPNLVEGHLEALERASDAFRALPIEATPPTLKSGARGAAGAETRVGGGYGDGAGANATARGDAEEQLEEQWRICQDLQVDVAVLLESALMAAQQALAEYKKMHCRLELLATEYDPVCRLEMEEACDEPVFLPLLAEGSDQAAAAAMPERAWQWAIDFSQLVGAASQELEGLVGELERRRRQLKRCSAELRDHMLRRASCGQLALSAAAGS